MEKETSLEIFGLQGNRSGAPQSFIFLIDDQKAAFVNSYYDINLIYDNYMNGEKIDGRVFPGIYKKEGQRIFLYLIKGVKFIGNRIDDALYLTDHTGENVIFYKIHL